MIRKSCKPISNHEDNHMSLAYIQEKARYYLEVGPEKYSSLDFFEQPGKSLNELTKKILESGCRQLLENKGLTIQEPLTGLGIKGLYRLMEMFHFTPIQQELIRMKEQSILDRIVFYHRVMKEDLVIVLYNLVDKKAG